MRSDCRSRAAGHRDLTPRRVFDIRPPGSPPLMEALGGRLAGTLMIIQGIAETIRAFQALRTGVWPPRLADVEETETILARQSEV